MLVKIPNWEFYSPEMIVEDVKEWKGLVERNSATVITTPLILRYMFNSFVSSQTGMSLLTDRLRDQYYATGSLSGFLGLTWKVDRNLGSDVVVFV